ncbi:sugar ABC transporter substrate-binding protein [Bifidobacterium sp. MA2]|uniref:Sugar ABC transporter substrate-binding protein n=1 Tax=Bifidobacterium santillanense TaxID=2809028 RepID=A0ABS5UQ17_9BIFI|nr:sugar ABC transporter substrate-binding protein [Bifidobacterium santillanense]MBT1172903.1 sugar ABC transporter substrate-binding protein [Bifidobacterium santillanense]
MISTRQGVRLVAAAAAAVMAAAPLAACGNSQSSAGNDDQGEILVWSWESAVKKMAKGFEKENPGVTVKVVNAGSSDEEYSALNNALAAGSGTPDIVQLNYDAITQFVLSDALEDLDQFGAASIMNKFTDSAKAGVTVNGKVYSMPGGMGPLAMFYNKEIFDKAGVTEPPKTWDEFYEAAKKIHALGDDYYITADSGSEAGNAMSMMWSAGAQPFGVGESSVKIDLTGDKGTQRYIGFWQKMIDEHLIDTKTSWWTDEWYRALADGKNAAVLAGGWMPITLKSSVGSASGKFRVALAPKGDGSSTNSESGGGGYSIVKGSRNAKLAYRFLQYIGYGGGHKIQVDMGAFPAVLSTLDDPDWLGKTDDYFGGQKINEVLAEAEKSVTAGFPFLPYQAYANKVYSDTVGKAYAGGTTLEQGFSQWQDKLVAYGKEQGFTVK